jgi:hypothetical protein
MAELYIPPFTGVNVSIPDNYMYLLWELLSGRKHTIKFDFSMLKETFRLVTKHRVQGASAEEIIEERLRINELSVTEVDVTGDIETTIGCNVKIIKLNKYKHLIGLTGIVEGVEGERCILRLCDYDKLVTDRVIKRQEISEVISIKRSNLKFGTLGDKKIKVVGYYYRSKCIVLVAEFVNSVGITQEYLVVIKRDEGYNCLHVPPQKLKEAALKGEDGFRPRVDLKPDEIIYLDWHPM